MKLLSTIFLLLGISTFTQAQTPIDEIVKAWERAKTYTKEYMDAMPAESYGLKSTPEMRSFAQQMLHLSDGNSACESIYLRPTNGKEDVGEFNKKGRLI